MDVVFPSQTKLLLGDETEIFCENLDKCSIDTDLLILDGCFNGFDIVSQSEQARRAHRFLIGSVKERLGLYRFSKKKNEAFLPRSLTYSIPLLSYPICQRFSRGTCIYRFCRSRIDLPSFSMPSSSHCM